MKQLLACFFCALMLVAKPASVLGAPAKIQHAWLSGRDYVRLRDWAQASGFQIKWLKRDKVAEITGRANRLVVTANSAEVELNGVKIWLSFPVVPRPDGFYVSTLDWQTTLQPLLLPPRNPAGVKIRTICLDPGHGGKDSGNRVGSHNEKRYTLSLAFEVREQLRQAGLNVTLTRADDAFVELAERPAIARRRGADMFVSLHFNGIAVGRDKVKGSEIYCLTPVGASSTNSKGQGAGAGALAGNRFNGQNIFLAYQIQKALLGKLAVADRGVRRARFQVLRDAAMPAVLVEAGFMSHPVEGRKIFDTVYRRQMAKAIVSGILAYKRAVER